ncbi:unknown [Ruminococcus sp. CAG:330]|nr:unknown [Ruminococcus sp. CAG:330]
MEESKNALQHSGSGGKALIESIWSCSCITITLAKFLCDNADNLERYIRDSGTEEGRAWFEALRSMEEKHKEMHGE